MSLFEGYERRIAQIEKCCKEYGIANIEEADKICKDKGIDVAAIVKGIQPICFENACWAYTLGAAVAIKSGAKNAAEAAEKSASACRLSAFRDPLPISAKSVWGTAIWPPCCCAKKQSVSAFWPVMNLLLQPKARLVSL